MNLLQQAATLYAKLGWSIFPLMPGEKKPFPGSNGFKDATTDPDKVAAIWNEYPTANIGLACGKASGVYIVDIDIDEETGKNGFVALSQAGISLAATVYQDTPRGGRHLFFTSDDEIRSTANVLAGVDIRGDGGYVVLAPSVRADGSRYKWGDNFHPWHTSPIPYPDNMPRERAKPRHEVPAPVVTEPSRHTPEDLRRRIEAYIDRIDPAVEGQGGHAKLLWFFQCMVNGMCLSDDEAVAWGWSHFNPRCVPPWDAGVPAQYSEFNRKASQARKNPTSKFPYGWIRDDPEFNMPLAPANFDLKKFVEEQKVEEPATVEEAPAAPKNMFDIDFWTRRTKVDTELDFLCKPHGLVGDVAAYINRQSKYPQPFLSVAASLAFMGAVFGRKVRDESDLRTNLYTLAIGPSSSGKNNALLALRNVAMLSGHFDLIGGDEVTSSAAIETQVFNNPATVFLWDEIGFMFKGTKGSNEHKAGVIPFLMKLYSLASVIYKGRSYADGDKQKIIVQPCVSFYGTSTATRLKEGVSLEELEDGWIARVLMFSADPDPQHREVRSYPPPERLIEDLRAWKNRAVPQMENDDEIVQFTGAPAGSKGEPIPLPFIFSASPEATAKFTELREYSRGRTDQYRTLWLKAEENARRVSLIMAAGRNYDDRTIELIDADFACRLVVHDIQDFCDNIAGDVGNDTQFKNLVRTREIVESAGPEGILRSELSKRCSRWLRDLPGVIRHLLESEEIYTMQVGKGQRFWAGEYKERVESWAIAQEVLCSRNK